MIENIEVTEKGIEMLKRVDAWYAERIIIPKEIIIEAYNKYIKEGNGHGEVFKCDVCGKTFKGYHYRNITINPQSTYSNPIHICEDCNREVHEWMDNVFGENMPRITLDYSRGYKGGEENEQIQS